METQVIMSDVQVVLRQRIADSLTAQVPTLTRRDVRLPEVRGKAHAIIGMRRSGKSTFLWQCLADRLAAGSPREALLYLNLEDERLNGMTAADLAQKHCPDLILMDLKMPEMNGIEVAKLIRAQTVSQNIPIVLISASPKLPQIKEEYTNLFHDFLMKPVHLVEVVESLKKCLAYKVVENRKNEDYVLPEKIHMTKFQRANLQMIINEFTMVLMPLYLEVQQNQKMELIEDFGQKLIAMGNVHEFMVLKDFGAQVCQHAENFDIEKLLNILKMFPNLIAKFN